MNALTIEWRMIGREIDGDQRKKLLEASVEEAWFEIDSLKNFRGEKVFPQLSKLARCVMSLPHSNAAAERAFSIVTDVKTQKRNRMGIESLNAIAVIRTSYVAKGVNCTSLAVKDQHFSKFNQEMYPSKKKATA